MTTINLQQNQEQNKQKISARTANGGFWFSLAILVLTVLALFGIRFYIASVVAQNKTLTDTAAQQNKNLAGENTLQRILDMQTRLAEINKNLSIKDNVVGKLVMTEVLDNLEKDMNSGVVVSSFMYDRDSNSVKVSFDAHNYNDSGRQILNFKKSEYFKDASLGQISRSEKGVNADVDMQLKK